MAKPRVFLSSTYYDLYQSREDIELFVRSLGFDCVRHETGAIPYARDSRLESSAYREVEQCDLFITIIGGKFGSESKETEGSSITQNEISRALEKSIQVYIFVEQNTLTEYQTWKINKENNSMKFRYADDVRIYQFIDRLYALPQNNPITGFKTISDVTSYLQEQWAGLFQRYLSQQQRSAEVTLVEDMKGVATTLKEMVDFLQRSNQDKDEALRSIMSTSHPIFAKLAKLTGTSYRVYFTNKNELRAWLKARSWTAADKDSYSKNSVEEWYNDSIGWLEFKKNFFTPNGQLVNIPQTEWNDDWIQITAISKSSSTEDEDDIPF
ncbi:hypothetical protein BWP39_03210 [Paraburkholderia acidicola]|uniref:DUF4062 domain-containing protein n=1 Tax=Paraburkholderia acidicola TaxID=1912599 RepID=A0A2A4F551_9BURK|nr:DUF4062 domain-containing protein [Paraburkholderia acidicola]PCE27526.1 hypothetical protein BWP39_03210 [Paraburkholderia acidicola]